MPRIATRLAGPGTLGTTAATKITVSAAEKNIIKHIHVINPSASSVNFTASIGADAAATRIFDAFPIPAGQVLDAWGCYTLEAAEIFQAFASTTGTLVLTINGDRSVLG